MKNPRLLIVEDDPALLRGLVDAFQKDRYEVQVACDGDSAVDLAANDPPDVVLLDIMLPGANGFEVCRALRQDEGLDMPILMLTARGQENDIVRGLNLGADDYIIKPFSIHELQARLRAALRRYQGGSTQQQNFGTFTIDAEAQRVLREGVEIHLTPQEFSLLIYFVNHSGRALTREMILRAVAKRSLLTTTRSIDRCVKNLRAKLGEDPKHPRHIITVREVGYRFEA